MFFRRIVKNTVSPLCLYAAVLIQCFSQLLNIFQYPSYISYNSVCSGSSVFLFCCLHPACLFFLGECLKCIQHALGVPDAYIIQRADWENDGVLKAIYTDMLWKAKLKKCPTSQIIILSNYATRNATQKNKTPENQRLFNAADRNRTGTGITTHGILSPGRLPVPPLRHNIWDL